MWGESSGKWHCWAVLCKIPRHVDGLFCGRITQRKSKWERSEYERLGSHNTTRQEPLQPLQRLKSKLALDHQGQCTPTAHGPHFILIGKSWFDSENTHKCRCNIIQDPLPICYIWPHYAQKQPKQQVITWILTREKYSWRLEQRKQDSYCFLKA